jgi:hypothetical protein
MRKTHERETINLHSKIFSALWRGVDPKIGIIQNLSVTAERKNKKS